LVDIEDLGGVLSSLGSFKLWSPPLLPHPGININLQKINGMLTAAESIAHTVLLCYYIIIKNVSFIDKIANFDEGTTNYSQ